MINNLNNLQSYILKEELFERNIALKSKFLCQCLLRFVVVVVYYSMEDLGKISSEAVKL